MRISRWVGRRLLKAAARKIKPVKTRVPVIEREVPRPIEISSAPVGGEVEEIRGPIEPLEVKGSPEPAPDIDVEVEELELPEEEEKTYEAPPPQVMEELDLSQLLGESATVAETKNLPPVLHRIPKDLVKKIPSEWKPPELTSVDEKYPLIPPHAYARIKWVPEKDSLFYFVIEPPLTLEDKKILDKIRDILTDILEINLYEVKATETVENYLESQVKKVIKDYGFKLSETQYEKILYYLKRDFLGLERIEPLMRDVNIEDISCIGANLPIYVYHRKYGSMRTNVKFDTTEELNRFIIKLAQRCGRHISVANPLLDGALPDGSRVQATLSTGDIAMKGSTFTIRKFTKDPLTITDLMRFGTVTPTIAAFLWLAIEYRRSVLVSGGTATGKTTVLNALAEFIPPEAKIISIEDTPELRLPHENWVPKVARAGFGPADITGRRMGEVSMFDLLKAALRERPDYIIVGEVRGKEAYVLFQGMATGHPGMATIHAEDMNALINRLITPPISLPPGLLQSLDIVIFMTHSRVKGLDVRRMREVIEIVDVDLATGRPITNTVFRWNPADDSFSFVSDRSYIMDRIIEMKGVSEESIWNELKRRIEVLEYLRKNNIRYYRDVGRIIAEYYKNPEELMAKIVGT